jgi:hypothetical protein
MKTRNFTPIKIGEKTHEKDTYLTNVEIKKKRFNELFAYIAGFVRVEDKQRFKSDIYGTFISEFSDLTRPSFPTLTISKIAELHNLQLHKLEALINSFNDISIDWDFDTNTPSQEPCFEIMTTCQEQNDRYQNTKAISEAINKLKKEYHIYPADVCRGFNGTLAYNHGSQEIVPSQAYVLGEKIRSY